jgi:hypothetical protein
MTEKRLSTTVFTSSKAIVRNELIAAAINAVRDDLPPAAAIRAVLASSEKKTIHGEDGREYTVDVFYTPRGKQDEAVDVDQHLESLETPVFNPRDLDETA